MNTKITFKNVACLALVVIYFLGLILMFCGRFSDGLLLWALSTIAGAVVLWAIRRREEKENEKRTAETGENDHADEA